jgi:hypothetical protein
MSQLPDILGNRSAFGPAVGCAFGQQGRRRLSTLALTVLLAMPLASQAQEAPPAAPAPAASLEPPAAGGQGLGTEQGATSTVIPSNSPPLAPPPPALPPPPPPPPPVAPPSESQPPSPLHPGQARRGLVLAASLGLRPVSSAPAVDGKVTQGQSLVGSLAIGFKVSRVMLTLGVDLGALDRLDAFGTYTTTTTLLVVPNLQVALVRSRDHRVELVASLRAGAGTTIESSASLTTTANNRPLLLLYEAAPAVRFWAHRQFAVSLLAGYGGQYKVASSATGQNTVDGVHSLVAAIGGIGIF